MSGLAGYSRRAGECAGSRSRTILPPSLSTYAKEVGRLALREIRSVEKKETCLSRRQPNLPRGNGRTLGGGIGNASPRRACGAPGPFDRYCDKQRLEQIVVF